MPMPRPAGIYKKPCIKKSSEAGPDRVQLARCRHSTTCTHKVKTHPPPCRSQQPSPQRAMRAGTGCEAFAPSAKSRSQHARFGNRPGAVREGERIAAPGLTSSSSEPHHTLRLRFWPQIFPRRALKGARSLSENPRGGLPPRRSRYCRPGIYVSCFPPIERTPGHTISPYRHNTKALHTPTH